MTSTVSKERMISKNSLILNEFGKLDYFDCYKIRLKPTDYSVDTLTTKLFKTPNWVNKLMKLRDAIVSVFGLKTGGKEEDKIETYYSIGSRAVYFTVIDRNENEIVMAEKDKHLNFRTSVMIERDKVCDFVFLSTIVQFNNSFGKLYFLFVKPFHRLIIKSTLKRCCNECQ